MDDLVVVAPLGGEVVGDAPDRRVEILSETPSLHATWSRFGPGREGADLHVHRTHTDCFYVLAGELALRLGTQDEVVAVPAGTLARIPAGVVHGFRNAGAAELRYLNLHAPGRGFARYLRGLRRGRPVVYDQYDPPADGGRPPGDAVIGGAVVLVTAPERDVTLHADVGDLAVAEIRCAAGTTAVAGGGGPATVSLQVLDGVVRVQAGRAAAEAAAGTWLQVAPGVPHAVVAAGDASARVLLIATPGRGLRARLTAGG